MRFERSDEDYRVEVHTPHPTVLVVEPLGTIGVPVRGWGELIGDLSGSTARVRMGGDESRAIQLIDRAWVFTLYELVGCRVVGTGGRVWQVVAVQPNLVAGVDRQVHPYLAMVQPEGKLGLGALQFVRAWNWLAVQEVRR